MQYQDMFIPAHHHQQDLIEHLVRAIHGVNRQTDNALGIAFPRWVDPSFTGGECIDAGQFGCIFRVFGDALQLQVLSARTELIAAHSSGQIRMADIREIPSARIGVRFRRLRTLDKLSPAHQRRADRLNRHRVDTVKFCPPFLKIGVKSNSTGQPFTLRVYREAAILPPSPPPLHFDSYGLIKGDGLLPDF